MKIYFADSKLPELRELPRATRLLVVRRALARLHERSKFYYWLPTILCAVGVFPGSIAGSLLMPSLFPKRSTLDAEHMSNSLMVSMGSMVGMVIVSLALGYVGQEFQRRKFRPFLTDIIGQILKPSEELNSR